MCEQPNQNIIISNMLLPLEVTFIIKLNSLHTWAASQRADSLKIHIQDSKQGPHPHHAVFNTQQNVYAYKFLAIHII